jgi:hypothetical protein
MIPIIFSLVILALVVITLVVFNENQHKSTNMSKEITNLIDNKSGQSNSCTFMMNEITSFKWDKMLIYDLGSSNSEISKTLGVDYKDSVDLVSGLVFVYDNKVVFKEKSLYYPEHPNKLKYSVGNNPGESSCRLFTQKNAIFKGSKEKIDGVYYYEIKPLKTN